MMMAVLVYRLPRRVERSAMQGRVGLTRCVACPTDPGPTLGTGSARDFDCPFSFFSFLAVM